MDRSSVKCHTRACSNEWPPPLAATAAKVSNEKTEFDDVDLATATAEIRGEPPIKTEHADGPGGGEAADASADAQQSSGDGEATPVADDKPKTPSLEELQLQISELSSRERASAARASHVARMNNQLSKLVNELQDRLAKLTSAAPAPASPAPGPDDDGEEDILAKAPDLEKAVLKRLQRAVDPLQKKTEDAVKNAERALNALAETQQVVQPIAMQRVQEDIARTHKGLDDMFGKVWRSHVGTEEWNAWLERQDEATKRVVSSSPTFDDNAAVVAKYFAAHGIKPERSAIIEPNNGGGANDAHADAKQQLLRNAAGINSRSSAVPPSGPGKDDFEGNFAVAAARLKRA